MVYVPLGGNMRKRVLPPPAHGSHSEIQCKWKAGFFPFLRRGWEVPKRDRIQGSITQPVLKEGAERNLPSRGSPQMETIGSGGALTSPGLEGAGPVQAQAGLRRTMAC